MEETKWEKCHLNINYQLSAIFGNWILIQNIHHEPKCTNVLNTNIAVWKFRNGNIMHSYFCLVECFFFSSLISFGSTRFDYLENELMINIPDVCVENNHCITFCFRFLYLHSLCSSAAACAMLGSWTAEHLHSFSIGIDILCEYQFSHFNLCKIHCKCELHSYCYWMSA